MKEIEVRVPAGRAQSYRVVIGHGIVGQVLDRTAELLPGRRVFVVTDANLARCGHFARLVGRRQVESYTIEPAGEISKNMETVGRIVEAMEAASLGRDTVVVALGGGTVGDIAGFAAAIFKRGVAVVHVPTTTVSQADSAIGGKTGVDSTSSKNAYGAMHHPSSVLVDVDTLASLDARQFNSGLVESVKHGLIADSAYFEYLERNIDKILARETSALEYIAAANVRIKGSIVQEDPTEENLRRVLNYGHTIGHAVESASNYGLLHGEAVAIGLVAAGMIEAELGLGNAARCARVKNILERLVVPTEVPEGIEPAELIDTMQRDKKAVAKWPRFILLEDIGRVYSKAGQWAVEVQREVVEKVLHILCRQ